MTPTEWTAPSVIRPGGDTAAPERELLPGYLSWQRNTFLAKCAGLTGEQLGLRSVAPSSLSLLGLVRHLAKVERTWLRIRAAGEDVAPLHPERDSDFDGASAGSAEQDYAALVAEMASGDAAVATLDLDTVFLHEGEPMSLRMTYIHLIGEYARHNGHAALLRERIDGSVGA